MRRRGVLQIIRLGFAMVTAGVIVGLGACALETPVDLIDDTNTSDNGSGNDPTPAQDVPDSDADGVADDVDACLETSAGELVDSNGCARGQLDTDGDGVSDDADECPGTAEGAMVDTVGCGVDTDGDGVPNASDVCAGTMPGEAVDATGCASSQLDTDGDGISDLRDLCANTQPGEIANAAGCSANDIAMLDADDDGVPNQLDECPETSPDVTVDVTGCPVSSDDGSTAAGPSTPPGGPPPPPPDDDDGPEPDCDGPADCDDGNACTLDDCTTAGCANVEILGCVPCTPTADVVFVMDTSGSMIDEADALCSGIGGVVDALAGRGFEVHPTFLGITERPAIGFSCLSDDVVSLLGPDVPGDAEACPFPNTFSALESWGPATAIVVERFPWTEGALRLIVPMGDGGPCDGSFPGGCNDPGDDRDSISNAISLALTRERSVIISPITGTGSDACVTTLAADLAGSTGGIAFQTVSPQGDLAGAVEELILAAFVVDAACDDGKPCTQGDVCADGVCQGVTIPGCIPCDVPEDCDDANACTTDACMDGVCDSAVNFDEAIDCCNPVDGMLTIIEDGDPCTDDECDAGTGQISRPPAPAGTTCVDGNACTVFDVCDGNFGCAGSDINAEHCTTPADCFGRFCNAGGQCVCDEEPDLCIEPDTQALSRLGCFDQGEEIVLNVTLGPGAHLVVGGQFFIDYDPAALQFLSVVPGSVTDPESPFSTEVFRDVDEPGLVVYAVGIGFSSPDPQGGSYGPAILATLRFRAIAACASTQLRFLDESPKVTVLTGKTGPVLFSPCTTSELTIRNGPPVLSCPQSTSVDAAAGGVTAPVTWDPVAFSGGCKGSVDLVCGGTNSFGGNIDHLISSGGSMPAGLSEFSCVATDDCGRSDACNWNVEVSQVNNVEASVQLSAPMAAGPFQRCIHFEFFSRCVEAPRLFEKTFTFGLPFNLPGRADSITFDIQAGAYSCVIARDPLHTLPAVATPRIVDERYVVDFTGDPPSGGNWLVGGNVDGNDTIDMVDLAIVSAGITNPGTPDPNTPCGALGPHADINGDGVVDEMDLAIVDQNLFAGAPLSCCLVSPRSLTQSPRSEIPVAQLDAMGLGHLRSVDLNSDGVIDAADIAMVRAGNTASRNHGERGPSR